MNLLDTLPELATAKTVDDLRQLREALRRKQCDIGVKVEILDLLICLNNTGPKDKVVVQ